MKMMIPTLAGAAFVLTACGGAETSGSNLGTTFAGSTAPAPISPIQELRDEAARLESAVAGLVTTSAADLPATGSARFTGIATFGILVDSPGGVGVGGDLEMTVGFAEGSLTGTIDNFYSRNGDARQGSLTLVNGFVTDSIDTVVVGATIEGTLDLLGGDPTEVSGGLFGPMIGDDGDFIGGQTALELVTNLPEPQVPVRFEGAFIAERE